jgi:hypothetical protein
MSLSGDDGMDLKYYTHLTEVRRVTEKDRKEFETLEFDPDELLQVKMMERKELMQLMWFCGIRAFNEMPLVILEDNDMRMAYVVWRAERIKKKKESIRQNVERGIKWINLIQKMAAEITNL